MKTQGLLAAVAVLVLTQTGVTAQARGVVVETNKNLVLWCGASNALEQSRFPYLAAIRNYRSAKGANYDVATVYKKGKVVFRQYVYADNQHHQFKYMASGEEFTLKFKGKGNRAAELKAVVHDEDGVKMIAAGSIACARPKRG